MWNKKIHPIDILGVMTGGFSRRLAAWSKEKFNILTISSGWESHALRDGFRWIHGLPPYKYIHSICAYKPMCWCVNLCVTESKEVRVESDRRLAGF